MRIPDIFPKKNQSLQPNNMDYDPWFNDWGFEHIFPAFALTRRFTKDGAVPEVDLIEKDQEYLVKANLPGWDEKDLQIEIFDDRVILSGTRREEKEERHEDFVHRERSYGSFQRCIGFPGKGRSDEAKATLKNGLLEVVVPKAEPRRKGRSLRINSDKN